MHNCRSYKSLCKMYLHLHAYASNMHPLQILLLPCTQTQSKRRTFVHDAQPKGVADLSRAVQGMQALLTTQNVVAGFRRGYNNSNPAPCASQQQLTDMKARGLGGGGRIPGCHSSRYSQGGPHHPQAMCSRPRYENWLISQPAFSKHTLLSAPPIMSTNASERSKSVFASIADTQWPSNNSMIGIVDAPCMSAAAPLPL